MCQNYGNENFAWLYWNVWTKTELRTRTGSGTCGLLGSESRKLYYKCSTAEEQQKQKQEECVSREEEK